MGDELVAIAGERLVGKSEAEVGAVFKKYGSKAIFRFRRGEKEFDVDTGRDEKAGK